MVAIFPKARAHSVRCSFLSASKNHPIEEPAMNWIKQHPAQLSLAAISCGVIAATTALYFSAVAFPKTFLTHRGDPIQEAPAAAIEIAPLDHAITAVHTPDTWKAGDRSRVFATRVYVRSGDKLVVPDGLAFHGNVPNDWLKKHGLDLLSPTVLSEDPDRDGFSTLQEWHGMDAVPHSIGITKALVDRSENPLPDDSTNPVEPTSHPPYYTRLALNRIETTPFRLKFMSADVDAKNPKNTTMQINMLDLRMPSQYVPLGADIAGTHFATVSYEEKTAPGPDGTSRDVSELTIFNKKTGEKLVLPKGAIVDSPESYAVIDYLWAPAVPAAPSPAKPTAVFYLRKGETFSIPPIVSDTYRVVAIRRDEADVLLPSGNTWTVRKLR
jgi:hypothetical protein